MHIRPLFHHPHETYHYRSFFEAWFDRANTKSQETSVPSSAGTAAAVHSLQATNNEINGPDPVPAPAPADLNNDNNNNISTTNNYISSGNANAAATPNPSHALYGDFAQPGLVMDWNQLCGRVRGNSLPSYPFYFSISLLFSLPPRFISPPRPPLASPLTHTVSASLPPPYLHWALSRTYRLASLYPRFVSHFSHSQVATAGNCGRIRIWNVNSEQLSDELVVGRRCACPAT